MRSILSVIFPLTILPLTAQVNVTTYQYNNARTGANLNETILTPANVNTNQFGKLWTYPLDGVVYAQPLYLSHVSINGAAHNVVYIVTEHNSVYAIDADGGQTLWHVNLTPAGASTVPYGDVGCGQIQPEIGITSTPVIDPASGTIYTVAMTKESGNYVHRLHALDVTSGAERAGSPVAIQASVPGSGDGGSTVTLIPKNYKQRPGLLLLNGVVYIGMSSHCDIPKYHGWLLGYDAQSLQQVAVYNDTPNGAMGSFWASGAAPAADSAGNIYVVSGNGTFDGASGGVDLGESYIKLTTPALSVADYFTPFNYASLDSADQDTGSSGVALLGDEAGNSAHPHLMAGAGKEGRLYIIDRDNLSKWNSGSDKAVASMAGAIKSLFGNPAYFNNTVYFCGELDKMRAFPINNASVGSPVLSQFTYTDFGCVPTISANGSTNGIVWTLDNTNSLRALQASNIANSLYDTNQNYQRDGLDSFVKFSAPMVANGKVYAVTNDELATFGLFSAPATVSMVNAASQQAGPAAPGSLISIYGSSLAQSNTSPSMFPLPTNLGGASVTIGGVNAPLLYSSSNLINAQVPFETPTGSAAVVVNNTINANLSIAATAPGIFGAVNSDGTVNGSGHAASAGSLLAVFVTGLGAVTPGIDDGAAAPSTPLSTANAAVTATIGGKNAPVGFAGLAPGFAGLYQVNVTVPQLNSGSYPLVVTAGGIASSPVTITIQ
jgi:uncharacterized protein (TIGR03437 family)